MFCRLIIIFPSLPLSLSLSLSQSSLYKDYLSQSVSGIDMLHEKY